MECRNCEQLLLHLVKLLVMDNWITENNKFVVEGIVRWGTVSPEQTCWSVHQLVNLNLCHLAGNWADFHWAWVQWWWGWAHPVSRLRRGWQGVCAGKFSWQLPRPGTVLTTLCLVLGSSLPHLSCHSIYLQEYSISSINLKWSKKVNKTENKTASSGGGN